MEIRDRIPELLGQRKLVLVSLALTIAMTIAVNRIDRAISPAGMGTFYLQTAFDVSTYKTILAAWGKHGKTLFLSTLWVDYLYAVFYSLMLSAAISINSLQVRQLVADELRYPWWAQRRNLFIIMIVIFTGLCAGFLSNILQYSIISFDLFFPLLIGSAAGMAVIRYAAIAFSLLVIFLQMTSRKRLYREHRSR